MDDPHPALRRADGSTVDLDAAVGDPFPRARLGALLGRLPRYLRLAWGLAGEPLLPRRHRAGVLAAAGYLASPIDLVPGLIPVLGQLDDLVVVILALRAALRALDPATRERHLAAVGLGPADLDEDVGTLAATGAWLARRGVAIGRRLAILVAAASLTAGRAGVRMVRTGAPVVGRAGVGMVRTGAPIVGRAGGRLARTTGGAFVRAGSRGRDVLTRGRSRRPDGIVPDAPGGQPAVDEGQSGPTEDRG